MAWKLMKLVMKPGSRLASHVLTSCCCSIVSFSPLYLGCNMWGARAWWHLGIACWQLSLGGGVQEAQPSIACICISNDPSLWHLSRTEAMGQSWSQGLCHPCRGSNPSPWQLPNCRMRSPSLALGWSAGSSICWQGNFRPCLSLCSIWYPQPGQAWGLWWFLKYFCTTVMCLVMDDGVQSLPSSCSQTALCLFLTPLAGLIIEKGITKLYFCYT